MKAIVLTYDGERGFGFCRPQNGSKNVFFHIKHWKESPEIAPAPDMVIEFELGPSTTPGKPDQAINIRLVKDVTAGVEALNCLDASIESVTTGGK